MPAGPATTCATPSTVKLAATGEGAGAEESLQRAMRWTLDHPEWLAA
jgi:hypothetical protein